MVAPSHSGFFCVPQIKSYRRLLCWEKRSERGGRWRKLRIVPLGTRHGMPQGKITLLLQRFHLRLWRPKRSCQSGKTDLHECLMASTAVRPGRTRRGHEQLSIFVRQTRGRHETNVGTNCRAALCCRRAQNRIQSPTASDRNSPRNYFIRRGRKSRFCMIISFSLSCSCR